MGRLEGFYGEVRGISWGGWRDFMGRLEGFYGEVRGILWGG